MILRPYQEKLIADARESLKRNQSVIINLMTGGGKTCIAAFIAKQVSEREKRIVFTVHRRELLEQSSNTFKKIGIAHGIIAAGISPNPYENVQIASIDTLRRRELPPADIVFCDEVHHCTAETWKRVINSYKAAGTKIIGLSATPWRLSGEGLRDIFDDIVRGPGYNYLRSNGYLSDFKAYAPSKPDLSGARTTAGDFNAHDTEEIMDTNVLVGHAVQHYRKYANGLKTIGYAVSVRHSQHMAAEFNANGIPAIHIDGNTPPEIRKQAAIDFADGKYKVLWNCQLLTEGYDVAAQSGRDVTVEAIIASRPTQSLSLHLQMFGRGLRPKPAPCVFLDMAGNIERMYRLWNYGLPSDDIEWTLEGRKKNKKPTASSIPIRQCPTCYCCHKPAPVCPSCNYVYEIIGRGIKNIDGELTEFQRQEIKRIKKQELKAARTIEQLIALGQARNYKNPTYWASKIQEQRVKWRRT